MKFVTILIISLVILKSDRLFGQTIVDPVELPYFVIDRQSPYATLPRQLGGRFVHGFAAVQISVSGEGKLVHTDLLKIKVSGKTNLTYQQHVDRRTDIIAQYENFIQRYISQKIKIVKTEKPSPPKVTKISFLIKFR